MIVFGVIALLGLVLIRARFTTQLAGALLVIAAFMFVGVFFPLVTEHLFSEALLLTAVVVGLAWLASNVLRWFRGIQELRREMQASTPGHADFAMAGATTLPDSPPPESFDSPPSSDDAGTGESQ